MTELLSQREAAEVLALGNPRTLAAWRLRGEGPQYVRVGRCIRYRRADLAAWIESRVVDPVRP